MNAVTRTVWTLLTAGLLLAGGGQRIVVEPVAAP